jgi:integrase
VADGYDRPMTEENKPAHMSFRDKVVTGSADAQEGSRPAAATRIPWSRRPARPVPEADALPALRLLMDRAAAPGAKAGDVRRAVVGALSWYHGARPKEMCELRWALADHVRGTLELRRFPQGHRGDGVWQQMPMAPELMVLLGLWLPHHQALTAQMASASTVKHVLVILRPNTRHGGKYTMGMPLLPDGLQEDWRAFAQDYNVLMAGLQTGAGPAWSGQLPGRLEPWRLGGVRAGRVYRSAGRTGER